MSKFKLVDRVEDTREETKVVLKKRRWDSKEAANRAATEVGLQDILKAVVSKSKKED